MDNEVRESAAPDEARAYRLGRSPFWLRFTPESYTSRSSQCWRAGISQRPARTRRLSTELPLIDISPRHPLFTVRIGSESFPLLIDHVEDVKTVGRGIEIGGERRMMLKKLHTLTWTAKLRPRCSRAAADIKIEFRAKVTPPLPSSAAGDLQIQLFAPMHRAEPWSFPYAPASHMGAICLWSAISGVACSVVLPAGPDDDAPASGWDSADAAAGASLVRSAPAVLRRGRGAFAFQIRLDSARTRAHAQFMHMRFSRELLPAVLPPDPSHGEPVCTLRERAMNALQMLTDKGAYQVVGVERVYVKGDASPEDLGRQSAQFTAGFPHFPLDGARAMLDWHRLIGDEVGQRLALLIARGIATDFAVIGGDSERPVINKGAFWDRRAGLPGARDCSLSDYLGDEFHSVASTARIARGLFGVYEHTKDLITFNAAINACQWLILRQNSTGYYDGDRVCSVSGAMISQPDTMAGIEAIIPLMQAYVATRNEVYVKTAARIGRHATAVLMQGLSAPPIFQQYFGGATDTPATVATLVRALAYVHAQAATRRAREELEMAGTWLRAWDLSCLDAYPAMNMDGHYDGATEIARAALQLLAVERKYEWLEAALRIAMALPEAARSGWQSLPLFIEIMIGLATLIPGSTVDLHDYSVRASWSDFRADATTNKYITAHTDGADEGIAVDYLPLVCRVDGRVLVNILVHGPAERVRVVQNGREPNMRDLLTGELVCQPACVHPFPFGGSRRWACFVIEP